MTALRVLILGINYAPEVTGIAPYTTGLAEGLFAKGHDVHVLTGVPHYPEWKIAPGYRRRRAFADKVGQLTVRRLPHVVPDPPSARGRVRMEVGFARRALASRWGRPDVVVCVSPSLLSTAFAIAKVRSGRSRPGVGVWVQDLYSRGVIETGAMTGRSAALVARFESNVLRAADGVAAIHERFGSYLIDELSVDPAAITVIRNWTHLRPVELGDRAATRASLGWREDETIVLHAGNMGAKQGLENAVEAARLAHSRSDSFRFVLLGDGNQRARLEELADGVPTVQFIRPLPDDEYRAALAAADVLLVNEKSGVREMAVPSKITSYFTTGKPIVAATDAASITAQEMTISGGGLVVPPDDADALLVGVTKLRSDPGLADRMGRAGLEFCATNLSEQYAIDRYDDWIHELAASRLNASPRPKGT